MLISSGFPMIALREDCYLHLRKLRHKDRIIQGHTVTKQSRDLDQGSLAAKCMFTR